MGLRPRARRRLLRSLVLRSAAVVTAATVAPALAEVRSAGPTPSAALDVGTRTSGVGAAAPVAQPQPAVHTDVTRPDVAAGSGPDTPGKTGLGNTDRGPVGGAAKGPGTHPGSGAPVGLGTPAVPP